MLSFSLPFSFSFHFFSCTQSLYFPLFLLFEHFITHYNRFLFVFRHFLLALLLFLCSIFFNVIFLTVVLRFLLFVIPHFLPPLILFNSASPHMHNIINLTVFVLLLLKGFPIYHFLFPLSRVIFLFFFLCLLYSSLGGIRTTSPFGNVALVTIHYAYSFVPSFHLIIFPLPHTPQDLFNSLFCISSSLPSFPSSASILLLLLSLPFHMPDMLNFVLLCLHNFHVFPIFLHSFSSSVSLHAAISHAGTTVVLPRLSHVVLCSGGSLLSCR